MFNYKGEVWHNMCDALEVRQRHHSRSNVVWNAVHAVVDISIMREVHAIMRHEVDRNIIDILHQETENAPPRRF